MVRPQYGKTAAGMHSPVSGHCSPSLSPAPAPQAGMTQCQGWGCSACKLRKTRPVPLNVPTREFSCLCLPAKYWEHTSTFNRPKPYA